MVSGKRILSYGLGAMLALWSPAVLGQGSYERRIRDWRKDQEAQLKADDGWLAVTGLFWLKEGENRFGTGAGNEIVLPDGSAPANVGKFVLNKDAVTLEVTKGVTVTSSGKPVSSLNMLADAAGKPVLIEVNDLTLHIIKRGGSFGVRLKDKKSSLRRGFSGLRWYPVRAAYRIEASFIPHGQPREIAIANVIGTVEKMKSPGTIVFELNGRECRLVPLELEQGKLFIIFRDSTSGKTTYPAGRYLYAEAPKNGKVTLDFNQAINPPCAFTPYATCPLPPRENLLKVAIEAGELTYRSPAHESSSGETHRR